MRHQGRSDGFTETEQSLRKGYDPRFKSLLGIVIEHARKDTKRDGKKKKRNEKIIRSWKDLSQLRVREPIGLMPQDQTSQSVIDFNIWIVNIFERSPFAFTLKGWRMLCKKLEPLAGLQRLFASKNWTKIRSMLKMYPFLHKEDHGDDGSSVHLALANKAPSDIVLSLLKNHPRCTFTVNRDGLTPLALAVKVSNMITLSVFLSVLKSNPVATKFADKSGKLPLHHAALVRFTLLICFYNALH